jgi:pimeloyl-ACP methyl ester carboxylesterase
MEYRNEGHDGTLVLVHGIAGETAWQPLVRQLTERPELQGWDIHSFEYVAKWAPRWLRFRLARSPDFERVADAFVTYCRSTLNRYGRFAILAHSAGGLVALRALLDSEWLRKRTSHVALLATPAGSVPAARLLRMLSPQYRDLATNSSFLSTLQEKMASEWQEPPPFALRVVAAIDDVTVTRDSVFHRFPESVRRVVPGDHVTMIQPQQADAAVVGVVVNLLTSPRVFLSYVREDAARVTEVYRALESREFAPWIDQRRIRLGEEWEDSIGSALRESECFLVFLSGAAIAELSQERVFRREVDTAIRIQKERGARSRFIVPVRIEDVALPDELARFQWYDLFTGNAEGLASLLE